MTEIIKDRDRLARDLRTIADRIEDGEYEVTGISLGKPSQSGGSPGEFSIEYYTREEFERMARSFYAQTPDGDSDE